MAASRIRSGAALAVLLFAAATASRAQQAPATAPTVPDPAAQAQALREELIAAQQEIVRLRAEAANTKDLEASLAAARAKNERLVVIANELIAAYHARYKRGRYLPFEMGVRKFEAELQDTSDQVYDNRWNAGPRREAGMHDLFPRSRLARQSRAPGFPPPLIMLDWNKHEG